MSVVSGPWEDPNPEEHEAYLEARFGPTFAGGAEPVEHVKREHPKLTVQWLSELWGREILQRHPELCPVEGGYPLFYEGESHLLFGEGGTGKSWLAYWAALTAVRRSAQSVALLVDYESNLETVFRRLTLLGASLEECQRIAYWRCSEDIRKDKPAGLLLHQWANEWAGNLVLVVIDSVSKSMGAAGLKENENSDYILWDTNVVVPMTHLRVTTLLIDHVGKPSQGFRDPTARGASSKVHQVSGAAYLFEAIEKWTAERDGLAKVSCRKDREGTRGDEVASLMHVKVGPRSIEISLRAPAPEFADAKDPAEAKRAKTKQTISELVQANPVRTPLGELKKAIGGRTQDVLDALKDLEDGGFVKRETVGQKAFYVHVKPYKLTRQAEPTADDWA